MATGYKDTKKSADTHLVRPGSYTRHKYGGKEIDPRLWSLLATYSNARIRMGEKGGVYDKLAQAHLKYHSRIPADSRKKFLFINTKYRHISRGNC